MSTTAQEAAARLAQIYGGINAAAEKMDIRRGTLFKIRAGKTIPGPGLEALLLRHLKTAEASPFGKVSA